MTTQMKQLVALCAVVLGTIIFFANQSSVASETNTVQAITGILTDPNFRAVLHALEQRSGTEKLAEPDVVTTYGRQVQHVRPDYILQQPQYASIVITNHAVVAATNVSQAALVFFKAVGVDLTAPGRSIAYNDGLGLLLVKATPTELDIIERGLVQLNKANKVAPQVHLKAYFIEALNDNPESLQVTLPRTLTNTTPALMIGILTDEQATNLLQSLRKIPGTETLAEPETVVISGRQAQMRAITQCPIVVNYDKYGPGP
jgi:Flp pilus assembly secretin CpaC